MTNEKTGTSVLLAATLAVCGSARADWPAIYYSPHEDDEAIAMSGSIAEHKAAGRPVYLVLITDGDSPSLAQQFRGEAPCSIPEFHGSSGPLWHDYHLTDAQFVGARKIEFIESARALGVDKVFILDNGQGLVPTISKIVSERYSRTGDSTTGEHVTRPIQKRTSSRLPGNPSSALP